LSPEARPYGFELRFQPHGFLAFREQPKNMPLILDLASALAGALAGDTTRVLG
jgi:hypothetical protein